MLTKEDMLFNRDEKGELICKEVNMIGFEDQKMKIIPLTRGEIKKLDIKDNETDIDTDQQIVLSHCKDPLFTEEEIKIIKPAFLTSLVQTILRYSYINIDHVKEDLMDAEVKKKLTATQEIKEKEA